MSRRTFVGKFLIWRAKHMDERYFVIILAAFIGFFAGIAAYALKTSVFYIEQILTGQFHIENQNFWYVIYPGIGIILTVIFIRVIIKDNVKHGIPRILYVISKASGRMKRHKVFSSIVGGSLTAGFGGSIGLESPIISTGCSIGSTIANLLRLNFRSVILLIGCGASGAMASIFTTPVAAVIFSLEVLMLDLTTASIIPLLMASVTGAITTKLLLSEQMLFNFDFTDPIIMSDIPYYAVLGIITGFVSLYFNRINHYIREKMGKIKDHTLKIGIGVIGLGLLIFLFPPLYGEGYDAIRLIASGESHKLLETTFFYQWRDNIWVFSGFIILLLFLKVIATTLTIESGGIGGYFAPSAIMGGLTGFVFSNLFNDLHLEKNLSETNFTLVGMAGVLGAVMHAPLTAIFLIAEMTNGYQLIVPLMLATAISFITIKTLDTHSIFTKLLARKGELITHHKDQAVLRLMNVKKVIDNDLKTIQPGKTLGDLIKLIEISKRNIFPVVDDEDNYYGVVVMDDIRQDMFHEEKWKNPIEDYIIQAPANVSTDESMETVMNKLKQTGNYNLPVVDDGKYIGFVSRANIFSAYRKTLIDVTYD